MEKEYKELKPAVDNMLKINWKKFSSLKEDPKASKFLADTVAERINKRVPENIFKKANNE